MWIKRISLRNWRSFPDTPQSMLAQQGYNVIVGENNAGKSSVFAALEHALRRNPVDWKNAPWGSTIRETVFELDIVLKESASEIARLITGEDSGATNELATVLEDNCEFRVSSKSEAVRTTLTVNGVDLEQLHKGAITSIKWRQFNSQVRHGKPLLKALTESSQAIVFQNRPGDVIAGAVAGRLRRFADIRIRPVGGQLKVEESLDGRGTADFLFTLKNGDARLRAKYGRIQQRFRLFFPNRGFECNRDDQGNARISFIRDGFEFDIQPEHSGTGLFELLHIIANLEDKNGYIFVVEEPGSHLHPQAQRALQRLMIESAEKNQVFVTSHSPEFVHWANLSGLCRAWMKGPETLLSQAQEGQMVANEKAILVESLRDPRRREVLFARAVALVEGETEEAYLESLAPRLEVDLDALGVSVISVSGEGNYVPYMKYLEALSIPFVCQRDKYPNGIADKWKSSFFITDGGFESFMEKEGLGGLLQEARKAVGESKARRGRYCGENVTLDKVPKGHREFVTALKSLPVH